MAQKSKLEKSRMQGWFETLFLIYAIVILSVITLAGTVWAVMSLVGGKIVLGCG